MRQVIPFGSTASMAPSTTDATPVHSTATSGWTPRFSRPSQWYWAPRSRTRSGLGPSVTWSRTCTSSPRWTPRSAASSPTGPAPVTMATFCFSASRAAKRSTSAQAFATMLVGSISTPARPRRWSTRTSRSAPALYRSRMKPSRPLMPCSVYRPLLHMSHCPAAQFGQGTGSGHRTMHADEVALGDIRVRRRVPDAPERLVAEHQPVVPGWGLAVLATDDLGVRAADADREHVDEDVAVGFGRFGDVGQL